MSTVKPEEEISELDPSKLAVNKDRSLRIGICPKVELNEIAPSESLANAKLGPSWTNVFLSPILDKNKI